MGHTLLITPDGPRGPKHQMKRGAHLVAQRTRRPLILLGVEYARSRQLRNWDSFEIPYPWTDVRAIYSDPIMVPDDVSGEPFDALIADAARHLDALTRRKR
jgi:lysophospholipid acyltransferase (LPLAT)-like uncharacterized protein